MAGAVDARSEAVTTIVPRRHTNLSFAREAVRYKDLLYFLVKRDIKVRYAQTVLGLGWAVLQPVLTMVVFSIFFGSLANIPSEGVPYPVFSLPAVVLWTYFANSVGLASSSLVGNAPLLSKVYFPRLFIPLAPIGGALLDLAIAFAVLLAVVGAFGYAPPFPEVVLLPLAVLIAIVAAIGVGLWFAALAIRYRDLRYTTPFILQLWLFLSPVIYSLSEVPAAARAVYALNPMAGPIDAFRVATVGAGAVDDVTMAISSASAVALLASGALYFRRTERVFADVA